VLKTGTHVEGLRKCLAFDAITACHVFDLEHMARNRPHTCAGKGSTSLCKVYDAIDRFSEGVDVTMESRAFADGFEPFAPGVSRSAIRRFRDRLESGVESHTRDVIGLPAADRNSLHP